MARCSQEFSSEEAIMKKISKHFLRLDTLYYYSVLDSS